ASLPSNPDAARFYSQGLDELRRYELSAARDKLKQVVDVEPDFPLGHLALAKVFAELGNDQRSQQEAKRAFELSRNLSREQKLLVEGAYRESTAEWEKAEHS